MSIPIKIASIMNKKYMLDYLKNYFCASYSASRKLKYNQQYAFRVRRSVDDSVLDIGFYGMNIDIYSLLSFVGNGSGFITILYDATGNGNHLIQSDSTRQPRIVNNGALEIDGGKLSMYFDGSNDVLACANSSSIDPTTQPLYYNMVLNFDVSVANDQIPLAKNTDSLATGQFAMVFSNTNSRMVIYQEGTSRTSAAVGSITRGIQTVQSVMWENGLVKTFDDAIFSSSGLYSGSLTSRNSLNVGARAHSTGGYTNYFKGKISEVHIMRGNPRRFSFETEQKKFFNIL
jgi:hypothetical protein